MTGLLLKDLYIMGQNAKAMLFILVVWSMVFLGGDKSSMFLIPMFIMVVGINVLSLFSYDRQTKWETYTLTMPVLRRNLVLEKYLYAVLTVVVFGMMAVAAVIIAQVSKHKGLGSEFWLELLINWLSGIALAFFYNSLSIPLTYWLGVEKARLIPSVLIGVSVFLFVAVESKYEFNAAMSQPAIITAAFGITMATAVMMLVSYVISVRIYSSNEF